MMHEPVRDSAAFSIRRYDRLADIPSEQWDRIVGTRNPFLSHAFLSGLEEHDCLKDHGWVPCHLAVSSGRSLIGAVPLYLRTNSFGEFVFDWAWAEAYERAGGRYYPKLVAAVPFTPVIGPRLLIRPGFPDAAYARDLLIDGILDVARQAELSSFHCLFPETPDAEQFGRRGLLLRKTLQFHWINPGYRDFDDFLDNLTSKRRKQLRRERREIGKQGIEIERLRGGEISSHQWRIFHEFYRSTFHRRWGSPRFTLDFFESLSQRLPDQTLLILARHGRRYVAGAFAMLDDETLYGRHWGCAVDLPFLHFELCYYQTIEYCIEIGLKKVDAGVQGEHKLNRGFQPVGGLSCHWIRHPGFASAIGRYLAQETAQIDGYIESLRHHLPFKTA
ncbi:MAG: GNAT family N-acetyltransferase [Gammaproteobacteria bacterium]